MDRDMPHQYTSLMYDSPADAARVVTELMAQARNKPVRVALLHSLSGVPGHYSDELWGWTLDQLKQFEIKATGDSYELSLPEPRLLEIYLDQEIDRLHGPGAAKALDQAIADGSVFPDSSR